MRRALLRELLVTALSIVGAVSEVAAGGPRAVNGQAQPMHWNLGQTVFYHPDSGPLGLLDNAAARALLAQAFAVWEAGPASITFIEGAPLGVDVNAAGFAFSNPNHYQNFYRVDGDGKSPVIFDYDGSIIDALFGVGAHFDILGVAGIDNPISGNPRITGASIIINGTFYDGISLPASPDDVTLEGLKAAMVHEIGHFINLDHSWLNHELALDGNAGNDIYVPSMFPIAVTDEGALATTHPDDERAAQSLYPSGFGQTISGSVSFAGIPFQGANVVLRKSGDPLMTAYSIISGRLFFPCNPASACDPCTTVCDPGNPPEQGAYSVDFLPAGNYSVCVEQIDTRISEENGTFIGPLATPAILPGPEECYDAAEGGTSADDPDDALPVTAGGGPVDLVLNALPATDPFEPNNTLLTGATLADLAGTGIDAAPGVLGAGDLDVFNVPVVAGQRVRIELDAAEMGSGLDAVVGFYNAANALVAISDDATDPDSQAFSKDPALDLIANFTGTAKVVVSSFPDLDLNGIGGGSTGGYWLRVEVTSDADGDGVPDGQDICPSTAKDDADRDGVCFGVDNCPTESNSGQDAPVKISGTMPAFGDVLGFGITPDDSRVLYIADRDNDEVYELYSVPLGGGVTVKLNSDLGASSKDIPDVFFSPDSQRAVYLGDQDSDDVKELYSVPIGGGTPVKLNGALVTGGDVLECIISPDSARVVYRADQDTDGVNELYSVPITGGTPVKISGTMVAGGSLPDPPPGFSSFLISANSATVVYNSDQDTDEKFEIHSVPIAGPAASGVKLNGTFVVGGDIRNFQMDTISARVVYAADQDLDEVIELYSVPVTGGVATKLNTTLPAGRTGWQRHRITQDGSTVVYTMDQDAATVFELYSVPIAGGANIKLSGTLVSGGDVFGIALPVGPADGNRMTFRADKDVDNRFEIYSVPTSGGTVVKLNATLPAGGNVTAQGGGVYLSTVVYVADQATDEQFEVFSVPAAGGTPVKVSGTMVTNGDYQSASFDAKRIATLADKDADDVSELYGTRLAGGLPVKLNGTMVSGGDVTGFNITIGNTPGSVVYMADQDTDEVIELYSRTFSLDAEADGVFDRCDLCPAASDADQADTDGNGVGDACESCTVGTDPDADGVCGAADNCPAVVNMSQLDFDADGAGDACDADDDNDGLDDAAEAALGTNPLDADSDNDGLSDGDEVTAGTNPNAAGSVGSGVSFHAGRVITSTADGASSVIAADVDGDGDLDVLSASQYDDKIAWYENNGASPPAWTARTISTAAADADSVFAGDVDGDGDMDVLSASSLDNKIAWYENNGASPPVWTARTISTAAASASSVFAADVDGDGDIDALSASFDDNKIAWYENDGASPPNWTARTITTSANGAQSVFAADVDGDGDIDVLSASAIDNEIAWYENNGASPPTWTVRTISTTAASALSVFAADVDGDGDVDALSASFLDDKIAWYENNGASPPVWTARTISTSTVEAYSVFAADVDGDGDTDVLSTSYLDGTIAWHENDGASPPVWTARTISTSVGVVSVIAADVDGDGDIDALSANLDESKISWYENQTIHSNASFTVRNTISGAVAGAVSVDAGDIDGDGDIDTMHGDGQGDTIRWFASNGARPPSFAPHTVGSTPTGLEEANLCDLDRDGDLDVLYATGVVDNIGWVENGGGASPTWTFRTISTTQDHPLFVTAGDIDGDGDPDVVASSLTDSTLAWYRNDGGAPLAFTKFVISSTPNYERGLATADMDRDGDLDIVAAVPNLGRVVWFENGGGPTPSWTEAIISNPNISVTNFVAVADINGDGDPDVVSASYNGNDIAWFESDGAADPHWTTHSIVTPFVLWTAVSAKDMDSDGDVDIDATAGANGFFWLDNDGNDPPAWTMRTIPTSVDSVWAFTPADLDADGDLDLVVGVLTQANGHEHEWWENRGGQFSLVTTLPGGAPSSLDDGSQKALLAIELTSNGRSGDNAVELATLQLSVTDSAGTTLSSDEANRLIERLRVYLDTGSSAFERGIDPLVTTVETLQLSPQVIRFASGDPRIRVAPGQTMRLFIVAELAGDASVQSPNSFRLVHLAQSGTSARDAVTGAILRAETVSNAGTGTITILPDAAPPFVTSVFPPNHAVDVSPATRVLLYFSEPVDPNSVAAGVTLYKAGVKVPGSVAVNGTAVTIDPEAPLALASDYVVQVTSLLRDRDGNGAVPFVAAFGTTAQSGFGSINASVVGDSGGGATLGGSNADDNTGFAAAALGDVNGTVASHGIADLIIGAPNSDAGGTDAGKATLVFGAPGLQANGSAAASLTYRTGTAQDFIGETVARAGDMNGDSVQDFLIGAPRSDQAFANAGAVYLVFGNAGLDELAPATLDLDNLAACSVPTLCGVRFLGAAAGDLAGGSISFAGDVNGDGHDDIIVGAPGASPGGKAQAGRAYLVYGPLGAGAISLSQVGSTVPGLVLNGESAGDGFGAVVSSWRDGGGDGFDDLLIGAPGATALDAHGLMLASAGYVYALQGGGGPGRLDDTATPGVIEMSRVANGGPNQVAGMVFVGDRANGRIGRSVTGAVDIDGNGTDDVVIAGNGIAFSIPGDDPKVRVGTTQTSGTDAGGGLRAGTFAASRDFGAVLYSTGNDNPLTVGPGGDLNADGFDDFIIGDPLADTPAGTDAGRAYVVLGLPTLRGVDLDLGDVGDTIDGFIVEGAEPGDNLGASVGGGADLNADGVDDGLVGAPFADADPGTPANAGETYVLSPLSPDEILGVNLTNIGGGVTRLEWSRPDLGASYNVYRGALSSLRLAMMVKTSGMAHLACGIVTDTDSDLLPDFDDATAPPAGDAWVYLVTGKNLRGEGPLGPSGASPPRINDQQCP